MAYTDFRIFTCESRSSSGSTQSIHLSVRLYATPLGCLVCVRSVTISKSFPSILLYRRRDIVLTLSLRPSIHTFCLSGIISQFLLVRFDSFLIQMISTMDSRYPISLVKIDPLTLELLPLFWYRQLYGKTYISFFV